MSFKNYSKYLSEIIWSDRRDNQFHHLRFYLQKILFFLIGFCLDPAAGRKQKLSFDTHTQPHLSQGRVRTHQGDEGFGIKTVGNVTSSLSSLSSLGWREKLTTAELCL